jgi:hypothetical protein
MAVPMLSGRCLCGDLRFECGHPVSDATWCHCESCRRASGAHMVAWMTVRRDTFKLRQGALRKFASSSPVLRSGCARCGTPLAYSHRDDPDAIDILIATLDEPGVIRPIAHVWMADAVAWDRPSDGLPQFRTSHEAAEPFRPERRTSFIDPRDLGLRRAP